MEVIKVLFITNSPEPDFSILRGLSGGGETNPTEAIILSPFPPADWLKALADYGIKPGRLIQAKPSISSILAAAEEEGVSLILINLDRGPEKARTDSMVKGLFRKSTVPVMVIPSNEKFPESLKERVFTHVIYATDWSPTSEQAFEFLLNFKEKIRELEIVNVISDKLTIRTLRELKHRLEEKRKICCQDCGLDTEFHIYAGNTWEEILKAADDYHATLIVLGTKRKEGWKKLFRKRTPGRVVENSRLPVLVVPQGET